MNNATNITNSANTEPEQIVPGQVPTTDAQVPHLRLVPGALSKNAAERAATTQKSVLIQQVDLATIRTDGEIRARIDVNPLVTAEYAQLMREGVLFLPVTVFFDDNDYWLADGFYRLAAAKQVGQDKIGAVLHHGSQRNAQLFAINANKAHGERYTTRDKRHAIVTLLKDAEWSTWSNYRIARQSGATEGTVRKYRKEVDLIATTENAQTRNCLRNGKTLTMNIGGLRAKRAADTEAVISPEVVDMTHNLPFADDAAQVSKLSTLSTDEQLQVVEIIANAQSRGQVRSVTEAILELKRQHEYNKRQADLQHRVDEALKAGYDDHFVLGNCAQVLQSLEPQSVRLLLADGPYGIGFSSSGHASTDRIAHDKNLQDALDIHRQMLAAIDEAMMPDCHVMLFCDKKFEPEFRQVLHDARYKFKDSLIWDKGDAGRPIPNQSSRRHERIIWFTRGNPQVTTTDAGTIADVLCYARPNRRSGEPDSDHLTPKPLGLMTKLIQAATVPGERVVDPFPGSASTLVAAKMSGRRYLGVELNTKWHAHGTARLNRAIAQMMGVTPGESTVAEAIVAEATVGEATVGESTIGEATAAEVMAQSLPDVTPASGSVEVPLSASTYQATVTAVA